MSSSKKGSNRPKKRTLVRWDDNLNEQLLLTVQFVCNANSIKIPWNEVANKMGHNVTEGAIVQHLAKLRTRRVAANKDVPPPLRRGGIGASIKQPESTYPKEEPAKRKAAKNMAVLTGDDLEKMDPFPDNSSDEDYGIEKRSPKKTKLAKRKVSNAQRASDAIVKRECESDGTEGCADDDELLVCDAKFLEYPNENRFAFAHRSPTDPTPSPSPTPRPSKVVVLRYRRQEPAHQQAEPVNSYEQVEYQNPYQCFADQAPDPLPETTDYGGGFETSYGMAGEYIPTASHTNMLPIDPEVTPSGLLPFGYGQGDSMAPYDEYHNGADPQYDHHYDHGHLGTAASMMMEHDCFVGDQQIYNFVDPGEFNTFDASTYL